MFLTSSFLCSSRWRHTSSFSSSDRRIGFTSTLIHLGCNSRNINCPNTCYYFLSVLYLSSFKKWRHIYIYIYIYISENSMEKTKVKWIWCATLCKQRRIYRILHVSYEAYQPSTCCTQEYCVRSLTLSTQSMRAELKFFCWPLWV